MCTTFKYERVQIAWRMDMQLELIMDWLIRRLGYICLSISGWIIDSENGLIKWTINSGTIKYRLHAAQPIEY